MKKICLLFCLILSFTLNAQLVTIVPLHGDEVIYTLNMIGRMSISSDSLLLYDNSGSLLNKQYIYDLKKIKFSDGTASQIKDIEEESVSVSVSPDAESLLIEGLAHEGNTTLRLFSLNGQLLSTSVVNGYSASISISSLSCGTYILLVDMQPVKFIKH